MNRNLYIKNLKAIRNQIDKIMLMESEDVIEITKKEIAENWASIIVKADLQKIFDEEGGTQGVVQFFEKICLAAENDNVSTAMIDSALDTELKKTFSDPAQIEKIKNIWQNTKVENKIDKHFDKIAKDFLDGAENTDAVVWASKLKKHGSVILGISALFGIIMFPKLKSIFNDIMKGGFTSSNIKNILKATGLSLLIAIPLVFGIFMITAGYQFENPNSYLSTTDNAMVRRVVSACVKVVGIMESMVEIVSDFLKKK